MCKKALRCEGREGVEGALACASCWAQVSRASRSAGLVSDALSAASRAVNTANTCQGAWHGRGRQGEGGLGSAAAGATAPGPVGWEGAAVKAETRLLQAVCCCNCSRIGSLAAAPEQAGACLVRQRVLPAVPECPRQGELQVLEWRMDGQRPLLPTRLVAGEAGAAQRLGGLRQQVRHLQDKQRAICSQPSRPLPALPTDSSSQPVRAPGP